MGVGDNGREVVHHIDKAIVTPTDHLEIGGVGGSSVSGGVRVGGLVVVLFAWLLSEPTAPPGA